MTISLDELEELARAAAPGPWWRESDEEMCALDRAPDAALIAACDPGTVLKLIAVAKRAKEACFLLRHTELSPTTADRCEALDEALTTLEAM